MKTFYKILTLVAVSSLALVSCAKKELPYETGAPELADSYGVYFPVQEASGSHTYDPEMERSISITVARPADKSNGAITVPYTLKASADGIFEGSEITFADGQTETEFEITFEEAEEGIEYTVEAIVDDPAYTFVYGTNPRSLKFSILIVTWEDFKNPKTGEPAVFTINSRWDGMFGPIHATLKYYEVGGLKTGVFTSIDKNADSGELEGFWHSVPSVTLNIRWYSEKNNNGYEFVELPKQYFGYDYNDGDWLAVPLEQAATPIYVYDYAWYWVERGYAFGSDGMGANWLEEAKATGQINGSYPVGYYDGNGGFFFNIYFFMPGLGGWSPDNYGTVAIADGFTRVDYSLEVEADYPDDGVTPVLFTVGADIAKVDYAIYEGSLTPAEIKTLSANIANGKEENVVSIEEFDLDETEEVYYKYVGLTPETTGEYTLVAVAFNKTTEEITKSEAQASTSVSFFHVAADDDAEYDVQVSAFTEDTPARYKELHNYDSFAYGVSGKDLTEVHIAFYTAATIQRYGMDAVVADLKADEDGKYTASEEELAQINADGGYYDVATGLNAKTTYYVMVWATNGSKESIASASYTTEALPYVWNKLGEGQYTEDIACGLYNMEPITVACNVYEEASTPGLYAIDGFQYNVACVAFGEQLTEEQVASYKDALWEDNLLIIDATNPESVSIPMQRYGICFSTDDGMVDGVTSVYQNEPFSVGTLKDGVITFETVKGLLCTMAGQGYYYANQHGAFKLVLPSAAPAALPATKAQIPEKANKTLAVPLTKYVREPKAVSVDVKPMNYSDRAKKETKQSSRYANAVESVR